MLLIKSYLPVPKQTDSEFWTQERIDYIRYLSVNGKGRVEVPEFRSNRILDKITLQRINRGARGDTETSMAGIDMSAPLYLGDMSYGALSGNPNIVIARVADSERLLAGTGEGGLHPEVAKSSRIFVQWASARFGVDIDTLTRGRGVVIKIGQGAKPGIGGHLPGTKVTEPISLARRIPVGSEAISPAPHHDIYSIEDLGQRIENLKEITGKPVFVKVAATNYTPFVVSGVARMGADGVIIDGHGAGTGATPVVIRDNVGIPIELAVASSDRILRREGLRDNFTIVAAGRVSTPIDAVKLMALGADVVSIGTGALIAMGCVMVHKCHVGSCPTALTNKIDGSREMEMEFGTKVLQNFIRGFVEDMSLVIGETGFKSARDVVGRREILTGYGLSEETLNVLGIKGEGTEVPVRQGPPFTKRRQTWLHELTNRGDPVITSMGSTAPPDVESPYRITDYLRVDGAQVTRPSIDPYREDIETEASLFHGSVTLSIPMLVDLRKGAKETRDSMRWGALALGFGIIEEKTVQGYEEVTLSFDGKGVKRLSLDHEPGTVLVTRTEQNLVEKTAEIRGIDGFLIEEGDDYLEVGLSDLDTALKDMGIRSRYSIVVTSDFVRDSGDVFKLLALGADAVAVPASILDRAIGDGTRNKLGEKAFNLLAGMKKELTLLAGAAGMYSLHSSLVGNREILRSVNLDSKVRKRLRVKPAGSW